MSTADRARRSRAPTALFLAVLFAGCGGDKGTDPIVTPGLPENSTPAGALARFEATYERQAIAEFAALFTDDFSFRFSEQADPLLALQFGTSWGVDDEVLAATHLFEGFTQADPPNDTFGPATNIAMTIAPQILDDPDHADSTSHYKVAVVPTVDLTITVLDGSIESIYEISARHDFSLVRGDAAVLRPGQPADTQHWYIRRWEDRTPAPQGPSPVSRQGRPGDLAIARVLNTAPTTWGRLKATYRR